MTRHVLEETALQRRDEIVAGALALLNEGGLEEVTLRRLASRLGMHAPGLYWYIENKQQLTDLMAKAVLEEPWARFASSARPDDWQEWLVDLACETRRALLAHRDGARLVAGAYLFTTGVVVPMLERSLEILEDAGFEPLAALGSMMTLLRYAMGIAMDEQASPSGPPPGVPHGTHFADFPAPPIDATQWPRTANVMQRVFKEKVRDREKLFRWGATLIVRGMADSLDRTGSGRPRSA